MLRVSRGGTEVVFSAPGLPRARSELVHPLDGDMARDPICGVDGGSSDLLPLDGETIPGYRARLELAVSSEPQRCYSDALGNYIAIAEPESVRKVLSQPERFTCERGSSTRERPAHKSSTIPSAHTTDGSIHALLSGSTRAAVICSYKSLQQTQHMQWLVARKGLLSTLRSANVKPSEAVTLFTTKLISNLAFGELEVSDDFYFDVLALMPQIDAAKEKAASNTLYTKVLRYLRESTGAPYSGMLRAFVDQGLDSPQIASNLTVATSAAMKAIPVALYELLRTLQAGMSKRTCSSGAALIELVHQSLQAVAPIPALSRTDLGELSDSAKNASSAIQTILLLHAANSALAAKSVQTPPPHLSFGHGPHKCPAAGVAIFELSQFALLAAHDVNAIRAVDLPPLVFRAGSLHWNN